MDMNKDKLMNEKADLSFWVLRLNYDESGTDSCEHLKVSSSISYGDVVKACAYIIKVYYLKVRDVLYDFPSNLEIALVLNCLYGFERVKGKQCKNENISENNRIKTINVLFLCNYAYDYRKEFNYDDIANKKIQFSRKSEAIQIRDEYELPSLVFNQKEIEECLCSMPKDYRKGYFEKYKMKNYQLNHDKGCFASLYADFLPASEDSDKLIFIDNQSKEAIDVLNYRIFYLSEIHNEMIRCDALYGSHFKRELSQKKIMKMLKCIYGMKLIPEKKVYHGNGIISVYLCEIQIDPDSHLLNKDYKDIAASGVRRALMRLASEEIKDETIKAKFIEKMNEYPISDTPDEIDLIKIKDYYRQN